ncbi:RNF13 [Symbiodinium sp. CCMP2456]|nr:RNF13 [Symbiodinium sp. CCMP2456]
MAMPPVSVPTPGPVTFAPGSPLASPFSGRGPLFSPMLDAGYTRAVASPLQASGAAGTPLSPLVAASYPRSVGGSPIPFRTSSPAGGPPRMLTPTSASPLAADRRTASPSQVHDVRRSLSPNLSQTRILQPPVVATKAPVSWTDLMQAPVGTRFVVPKGTLNAQEPIAGPDDAEASARPSPLQPAVTAFRQPRAKQAADKAAPGNIFSSPKRDAKKLAVKKQRELKKLLKVDRRENEDIARNLQEATRAKSSTETQAKEAASKLAKAEADLSAEKQSEDALQSSTFPMAAERLARLESIRTGLAALPRRGSGAPAQEALSTRERLEAIQRRLGLSPSAELYSEKVDAPWAPSLYDSWEHQTLRSEACEGVSHLAAGQDVQVVATSGAAEATEPRSRRQPASPLPSPPLPPTPPTPPTPKTPPTPPLAPDESEDWLWSLGQISPPSVPSEPSRTCASRSGDAGHAASCSHAGPFSQARARGRSQLSMRGERHRHESGRAEPQFEKPTVEDRDRENVEPSGPSEFLDFGGGETSCAMPEPEPSRTVPQRRPTSSRGTRIRSRPSASSAPSSRPPSAPSFVRPFSVEDAEFCLSGRGVGAGKQQARPPSAQASRGLGPQRSRVASNPGASKPLPRANGRSSDNDPDGPRDAQGGAQAAGPRLRSWRDGDPVRRRSAPAPLSKAPMQEHPELGTDLWQSMELKVFLRRADLTELLAPLREEFPGLNLQSLLEMQESQLKQIETAPQVRPLAFKRLLRSVELERQRRGTFLQQSAFDDDVSAPMRRPPAVSLDEGDGQLEGEVRDVQNERGRESASQMVARMLSTPTPSRPSLAHDGHSHSTQCLPDECIWEPSEPRSDPPEEHPVTEDVPWGSSCSSTFPKPTVWSPGADLDIAGNCCTNAVMEPAGPFPSRSSSSTAAAENASERSQKASGSTESFHTEVLHAVMKSCFHPDNYEERPQCPDPPVAAVEPAVEPALAVGLGVAEQECRRPQTRRARIRELLKRLDLAQSPCLADRLRVDARQKQAKERHLRQSQAGGAGPASASSPLSFRRSRSFMELLSEPHSSAPGARSPVDPSVLDDVVSRLPAKPVMSAPELEPCTICLEVPTAGEVLTMLPCCHWYHPECIKEWLLHSRLCPLCKAPVMPEDQADVRTEPEKEPDEEAPVSVKDRLLQRLTRMNTQDLLQKIRRNISSFSVIDIEDLSWDWEDISTEPDIAFAVMELQEFVAEWQEAATDKFWQRKSHKVVLAVVCCARDDGSLVAMRGMNTEVSLPSGSLCAERAGIARAATEFFHANTIKVIAVVDPSGDIAPLWPCEVCQSWLSKLRDQSPRITVVAFPAKENDFQRVVVRRNGKDVRPPTFVSACPKQQISIGRFVCFRPMAPLPGVHPGALPRSEGEDPVLSALQRYREAAGSTFHPLSEVEEPDDQAPFEDLAQRFAARSSPSASSSSSPKCHRPPVRPSEFHGLEEDVRNAVCGFGAYGDLRDFLPTWLSWMSPWLEPAAPELCGHGPSGQFAGASSMTLADSPRCASEAEDSSTPVVVPASFSSGIKQVGLPSPPVSQAKDGLSRPRVRRALEAIRELPDGLRSSTFDDLVIPEEVEQVLGPLPDCAEEGLEIGGVFLDYSEGWGLGKVCQGLVGDKTAALVVQLRLPKPLNNGQMRRLGAALRRGALEARSDLSRPLGAVSPSDGSAGVWIAWERPGGSCSTLSPLPIELQESAPGLSWRLSVARQLCLAVDALHRSGKVHGSLSPRNVLVATTGDVTILEAGLVDALLEVDALREHDLLGALGLQFARYVAPEGWHVPRSGGTAADIFALGLVLLEVFECCGQPNPECKSLQQLSAKMLPKRGHWQPQVKASTFYGELPQIARSTIELCFHADPGKRPSAQELLFGLAAPPEVAEVEQLQAITFAEFKNLLYGSDESDGLKSGSTAISGSSGKSQQDLDADLNAEVAEEQGTKPLAKPPRHMSWPSGPRPELRASPARRPGDQDVPEENGMCPTSENRCTKRPRAFSADDAEGLLEPPLPPPPPQLERCQVKASPRAPRVRRPSTLEATVEEPGSSALSPLSPGPPPPPPPPRPQVPFNSVEPIVEAGLPERAPSRKSRPPSPPRQFDRQEEAKQAGRAPEVPFRKRDFSPPPPEPPRPSEAMPMTTLWQMPMPVLYTPSPLDLGPMTKV